MNEYKKIIIIVVLVVIQPIVVVAKNNILEPLIEVSVLSDRLFIEVMDTIKATDLRSLFKSELGYDGKEIDDCDVSEKFISDTKCINKKYLCVKFSNLEPSITDYLYNFTVEGEPFHDSMLHDISLENNIVYMAVYASDYIEFEMKYYFKLDDIVFQTEQLVSGMLKPIMSGKIMQKEQIPLSVSVQPIWIFKVVDGKIQNAMVGLFGGHKYEYNLYDLKTNCVVKYFELPDCYYE